MTINEIHKKYKNNESSVQEIVKLFNSNIEKNNSKLNCFITLENQDNLQKRISYLDNILKTENFDEIIKRYPLFGIPATLKDIYTTKGLQTTAASNILKGYLPDYDATVVKKLIDAGAVILGKVNNDAFAHGSSGCNSDFGPTLNPYNLDYIPGGSSSGSGVSVVSNFSVFSMGTDTGGSVRCPACWCNLVGIKPTYGRVSRFGVIAMASSLDSMGHLTKTIEDNAKILSVTAGIDSNDATSSDSKVDEYYKNINKDIKGMRFGLIKEFTEYNLDSQIKEKIDQTIEFLKTKGADIVTISIPNLKYALATYYVICPSEISSNLARFDGIRFGNDRSHFGDEAIRRIMIGTYTLSSGYYDAYYTKAIKIKNSIKEDFKKAFKNVDAFIAPVVPCMPNKIGSLANDPLSEYLIDFFTISINMVGLPALSVPIGFSKEKFPIGIQIIGNYFEESKLYNIGYHIEQNFKCYEIEPDIVK